jgi:hypothetical protein
VALGAQPTTVGAAIITPWQGEMAEKVGSNTGADRITFGAPTSLESQTYSGVIRFWPTTTSSYYMIETSTNAGFEVQASTNISVNRSGTAVLVASSNNIVANAWNIVAWSVNRTTGRCRVALNGVLTSASSAGSAFNPMNDVQSGKHATAAGNLFYASCLIFSAFECFDDAFLTKVSRGALNVWQLFEPEDDIIYVSAGGTTYTITPTGGFVLAGTGLSSRGKIVLPTGGATFAGSGLSSRGKVFAPSGGVTFGGTGSMFFTPAGGATIIPQRTVVGAGV